MYAIRSYYAELYALIGVPQDATYHPEGDVWVHTMLCVDVMANLVTAMEDNKQKLKYFFAILCHDLGKAIV